VVSPLSLPLGGDGLYITADEFRKHHETVLELFDWIGKFFEDHGDEYYPHSLLGNLLNIHPRGCGSAIVMIKKSWNRGNVHRPASTHDFC
jgi:hypothetical protein